MNLERLMLYSEASQDSIASLQNDRASYQTVYADEHKIGSVAAPTAGLHFTPALINKLKKEGVQIEYVALHVGLGTFAPVKVKKIKDHQMHSELVEISKKVLNKIKKAKKEKRRIIAVGTTSARTLESVFAAQSYKQKFWTNIFIYPSYKFKAVDALITNFHLPQSTLLMLVSAFAGKKNIDQAYYQAIKKKYRFYSYGDAMLIY
jgi:S-adenosylmethionine:tRNA ribosyltransferase-isomerase